MSTENNTPVESMDDDLDSFAAELFGQSSPTPEPASSEEEDESLEDSDALNEDTQDEDDDTLATEEDDDDAEEQEETPKPKKSRFQERIDELTSKQREAEREAKELRQKLDDAIAKLSKAQEPEPQAKPVAQLDTSGEPSPSDQNEDGTDKYPLGEFDPMYIRDLMKHTLQQEKAAQDQEQARIAQEERFKQEQEALTKNWNEKLAPAQERYPDFAEKGKELISTFDNIDAAYGEYLSATLMAMDHGPDVLYYLANNPDEAEKIVMSGPTKATIALGRLESRFMKEDGEETQTKAVRVTNAPPPPPAAKGTTAAGRRVTADTDDLDAFSALLFQKKGR